MCIAEIFVRPEHVQTVMDIVGDTVRQFGSARPPTEGANPAYAGYVALVYRGIPDTRAAKLWVSEMAEAAGARETNFE